MAKQKELDEKRRQIEEERERLEAEKAAQSQPESRLTKAVKKKKPKIALPNLVSDSTEYAMARPPAPEPSREDSFTDPTTGMEMIFVKGGCYQMGDTFGDGQSDEKPVHEVCVNDFYIGKYEVTQGQWQNIMKSNPSSFKTCGGNLSI